MVTSGTIAIDAAGFVDVLTGFTDATIDTAAATFALVLTDPNVFFGVGGSVGTTSDPDPANWTLTDGTGFGGNSSSGSITVVVVAPAMSGSKRPV